MRFDHMLTIAAVASLSLAPLIACAQQGGETPAQSGDRAIPADGEAASNALQNSPRHGEWIDIALPGSDVKIKTWVVYPERDGKAPVVLVIHEIFGMTDWVRGVAEALAAEGFIAVAPDLLSGMGPNGGGTDSFEGDGARSAIRNLTPEDQADRLNAVRAHALTFPAAAGKTASIGFCWGGSASFTYACAQPGLNAAVVYYGTAPTDAATLERINSPVLGLYGGDDARVTSTVDATKTAMEAGGKTYEAHTYEGAGHGFLRQQSGREGANMTAAKSAWNETIAFLKKHLE